MSKDFESAEVFQKYNWRKHTEYHYSLVFKELVHPEHPSDMVLNYYPTTCKTVSQNPITGQTFTYTLGTEQLESYIKRLSVGDYGYPFRPSSEQSEQTYRVLPLEENTLEGLEENTLEGTLNQQFAEGYDFIGVLNDQLLFRKMGGVR